MVQEWVRGDHITYTSNPNYWGEKAKVPTVIFRWSAQAAQRLLELQSGTVDGIDNLGPEDFATAQRDTRLKIYPRPPLNIFYIGFNNTMPPFDNERVRQAIAMAIDRQRIVDDFYPGGSIAAEQFLPPALKPGYTEGFKWYDYNVNAAKQLLADAGFPNGFNIQLSYRDVVRGYLPLPGQVAQDIQAQLRDIGVTVTLNVMESTAFIDGATAGRLPFVLLGWGADYPDATNFMDYHFANANNKQFGNLFSDLAGEIRAAGAVADAAQRQMRYDRVNQLIKQHVPMIPVAHGGSATVFKSTVQGAHSSPLSNELFSVMSTGTDRLVWMQNAEPNSLWCADETDGETLRACEQIYESLLGYRVGGTETIPSLAESYTPNQDLTQWTFTLRRGVRFHNGHELNANDVVATYVVQWDAKSPLHKGRTGDFAYFGSMFGAMLNTR
jgi:ABC-type transport system substrate-binding protein